MVKSQTVLWLVFPWSADTVAIQRHARRWWVAVRRSGSDGELDWVASFRTKEAAVACGRSMYRAPSDWAERVAAEESHAQRSLIEVDGFSACERDAQGGGK